MLKLERPVRESDPSEDLAPEAAETSAGEQTRSAWGFRLVVAEHHRAVYRLCYGLLRDRHEAEDVTQEAFVRYWQHGGQVRGARAWLLTVARNACLDCLRKSRRSVDAEPAVMELQADERDPEWHAKRDESADVLCALVDGLSEPQRSLVLLFDVEGLSGAECADVLGLSINQVKVYLHRARRKLRGELEGSSD